MIKVMNYKFWTNKKSDTELLQLGSKEAFEIFYYRHRQSLWSYLSHLCARHFDNQIAEDLTHETFLRAYTKIGSFKGEKAQAKTWLYSIARNLYLDQIKSARFRYEETREDIEEGLLLADEEGINSSLEQLLAKETTEKIQRALKNLTEDEQEALMLWMDEDLSTEDMSKILGRSKQGTKNLIHRSKLKLKEEIR